MRLEVISKGVLPQVCVRLGAFEDRAQVENITLDGKKANARVERSGDSGWVRIDVRGGRKGFAVEAKERT